MLGIHNDHRGLAQALDRSSAVIHFDMNGKILFANTHFLNALGYSLNEVIGKHHSMFVDPAYVASDDYRLFWNQLNAGLYQSAQFKRIGKGGREVFIEATYNPVLNARGKPYKVIKIATDVTIKHVKMKEALDRTQATITFKLDGTIVDANANFLNTVGYTLGEIVGQHHRMFVDPAYGNSPQYSRFWQALHDGDFQAGEFERIGKGGRQVWLQASYNPIFGNDGKPFQVVKYATDITEQKAIARQTLETANAVATATHELTGSISEIARSMGQTRDAVDSVSRQTLAATESIESMVTAATNMGNIVSLIEAISGQINLLALNATIEAARAGEAGRGFSVVADEVKKLATQTGNSTTGITQEIQSIQQISRSVHTALDATKQMVQDAADSAGSVVAAIEEQSAVTNEISGNMALLSSMVNKSH